MGTQNPSNPNSRHQTTLVPTVPEGFGAHPVNIRLAIRSDLEPLRDLYNEIIAEGGFTGHLDPLTQEDRLEWFEEHQAKDFPLVVAQGAPGLEGYGSISPWRKGRRALDGTVEVSLYLGPISRGRGIGHALLSDLVGRAREAGHAKILAVVFDTNRPSLRLLEGFGFSRWGHLPDVVNLPTGRCGHVLLGLDLLASGALN